MKPVDYRNETWADIQDRLNGDRMAVYLALSRVGPCTTIDLAAAMDKPVTSVRPRETELFDLDLAELADSERRREGVYRAVAIEVARRRFAERKSNPEQELLRI